MTRYLLKCEVMSPVHIGSGSDIEPLDYIIRGNRLHAIAMSSFVSGLTDSERARFEVLINTSNLIGVRKFLFDNADVSKSSAFSVEVSDGVASNYRSKMQDISNQLLINPFIRNGGRGSPFIPGSSLKGAIRTALVNAAAQEKMLPGPTGGKEEWEFESKALGYRNPKNDPLRGIKVRDVILDEKSTLIREVRNASKKRGALLETDSIAMACEVTHSLLTGRPLEFKVEALFDDLLYSTGFLSKSLSPHDIATACNQFYRPKMEDEHKKFYKKSVAEAYSSELLSNTPGEKSFLLRVGRFSGAESVTLDTYRNPRPPGRKTTWGTSRNLAEGKYPMGWLMVTVTEIV